MMKTNLRTLRPYKIQVRYPPDGRMERQEIRGYPVVISGFEEFGFFVHRGREPLSESWRISEESTGFAFPERLDSSTRLGVIDNVARFLGERGKSKLVNALNKATIEVNDETD